MDLHLEGKVIIITGGFKGIGKGITLQLAQEGAIPVVINRSDSALEEFKKDIEQYTTEYDVHLLDLNDTDKIAGIVEETYKKYGHIDGIVNNAGKNDNKDLETTTWREFEESIHGNLTHYYELVHAAVPYLKESHGAVVNISSKTALTGQGKTSAYAAAKGAILGLTREWAVAQRRGGGDGQERADHEEDQAADHTALIAEALGDHCRRNGHYEVGAEVGDLQQRGFGAVEVEVNGERIADGADEVHRQAPGEEQ